MLRVAGAVREEVFDQERHAAERTVGQRSFRFGARLFKARMDDGVDLRIELLDARDRLIDKFER